MAYATVNEALHEADQLAQEACEGVKKIMDALEAIVASRRSDDGLKETVKQLSAEVHYQVFDLMNNINCAAEEFGCNYKSKEAPNV